MNVDHLDVQLVAREPAEAQDLGLQLLRRHAGATFGAVLVVIAPVWVLALLVGSASALGGSLAIWWVKPLMDRVAIHVLSRAVFGATPTILQTVAAVPSMVDRHLIALLTWRRLDFRRSLWFPAACLEGLRGKALSERYGAIKYGQVAREATVSTIVFLLIEGSLALAGFVLAIWMLPEGWMPDPWSMIIGAAPEAARHQWVSLASWLPGLLICEVAYTAAGFGMYVSRRTELEGWNVELAFQRLGTRLTAAARRGAAILVPLMMVSAALSGTADARGIQNEFDRTGDRGAVQVSEQFTEPGDIAREVLSHPDFDTTEERTSWVPRFDLDEETTGDSSLAMLLAQILKALGWVVVGALLIALTVYIARHMEVGRVALAVKKAPKPVEAFGLDLREESLPSDIAGAAKELARQGAIVSCLSLLYRGALIRLVESEELEILPGDTEHDCMRRVTDAADAVESRGNDARRSDYFSFLTNRWLTAAWGASPPGADVALNLCDGWAAHFQDLRAGENTGQRRRQR